MSTFKTDDVVCFRSSFLRSIGWHTDVPVNGRVLSVKDDLVKVQWSDGSVTNTRTTNLILESKKHLEPV